MKDFENRLLSFIRKNAIKAELMTFTTPCHTVEQAAASAKADPEDFVKSLCLIDEKGNLVVAIVPGTGRLDLKKAALSAGAARLRFANAEEVLQKTGYPVGGTPSFGYNALFLVDRGVLEKKLVLTGGGSPSALVMVSPAEMIKANGAKLADLTK